MIPDCQTLIVESKNRDKMLVFLGSHAKKARRGRLSPLLALVNGIRQMLCALVR